MSTLCARLYIWPLLFGVLGIARRIPFRGQSLVDIVVSSPNPKRNLFGSLDFESFRFFRHFQKMFATFQTVEKISNEPVYERVVPDVTTLVLIQLFRSKHGGVK